MADLAGGRLDLAHGDHGVLYDGGTLLRLCLGGHHHGLGCNGTLRGPAHCCRDLIECCGGFLQAGGLLFRTARQVVRCLTDFARAGADGARAADDGTNDVAQLGHGRVEVGP